MELRLNSLSDCKKWSFRMMFRERKNKRSFQLRVMTQTLVLQSKIQEIIRAKQLQSQTSETMRFVHAKIGSAGVWPS